MRGSRLKNVIIIFLRYYRHSNCMTYVLDKTTVAPSMHAIIFQVQSSVLH